jgi:hypothetical protein
MTEERKEKFSFTYEFLCPVCKGQMSYNEIMTMPIVGKKPKIKCEHCESEITIEFYADSHDGELKAKTFCIQLSAERIKAEQLEL